MIKAYAASEAGGELKPFEYDPGLLGRHEVEIDVAAGTLTVCESGASHALKPIGDVAPVIEAGGIFAYARETGMIDG